MRYLLLQVHVNYLIQSLQILPASHNRALLCKHSFPRSLHSLLPQHGIPPLRRSLGQRRHRIAGVDVEEELLNDPDGPILLLFSRRIRGNV